LEVAQHSGAAYFRVEINRGYGLAFYEPLKTPDRAATRATWKIQRFLFADSIREQRRYRAFRMGAVGTGIAAAKELRERGERQRASNEVRIAHRIAIKQELADGLAPMLRGEVEPEVLIRDADRQPDGFPKYDSKFRLRRLSPCFPVGVLPSYSGGMSAWLRLDRVFIEDGVARSQVKSDTGEGELVRVVGRIPYDAIRCRGLGRELGFLQPPHLLPLRFRPAALRGGRPVPRVLRGGRSHRRTCR
jgi:hypothetical protein